MQPVRLGHDVKKQPEEESTVLWLSIVYVMCFLPQVAPIPVPALTVMEPSEL